MRKYQVLKCFFCFFGKTVDTQKRVVKIEVRGFGCYYFFLLGIISLLFTK